MVLNISLFIAFVAKIYVIGTFGSSRSALSNRTFCSVEEQTLGGHKQNPVCTRTREKGAVTPQETDPDLPLSVQESLVKAWVNGGLLQGRGH